MLRVLQSVLVVFQRFPITPGNSTQHARDMDASWVKSKPTVRGVAGCGSGLGRNGSVPGRVFICI
jgi:hypothetical protein